MISRRVLATAAALGLSVLLALLIWRRESDQSTHRSVAAQKSPSISGRPSLDSFSGQNSKTESNPVPARKYAVGQAALSAPKPSELSTTERPPLANQLGAPGTPPEKESRIVLDVLNAYRRTFGAYPTGEGNRQIVNALLGANAQNLPFIPLDHPRLNARGEITDAWGTPFFFHVNSRDSVEVRSAGPDRAFYTADDLVAGTPSSHAKRPTIPDRAPPAG
jgi:hypothetical protein